MRAIAITVALLAMAEFALVGGDGFFRSHSDEIARAAFVGIVAGWLGLVAAVLIWRRARSALHWFVAWGITSALFMLLMPILALRHPAPEEQFSRSVLFAVLFGCAFALLSWRIHRALHVRTNSPRSAQGGAGSATSEQRHD